MDLPDSSEDGGRQMCDPTVTSLSALQKKDKTCLVCGDKALGYNFNAVSCESCKAFFRRNAHKTIRGRCEGKCDVNVESRSFCKRCRLAKCFTVGMRKDMILNDEQKRLRKQKIMFNKWRRTGNAPQDDGYDVSPNDLLTPSAALSPLAFTSADVKVKQESVVSPTPLPSCNSPREPSPVSFPSWTESQDRVAWAIQQLSEEHQKLVAELQYAMEESSFLAVTSTSMKSMPSNPTEFINMAEGFVRKVIKVAKNIASFKTLQKDDQISLLKGSVVDIMMLRSAINYDPHTESWSLSTKDCLTRRTPDGAGGSPSASSSSSSPSVASPHSPAFSLGLPSPLAFVAGSPGFSAPSPGCSNGLSGLQSTSTGQGFSQGSPGRGFPQGLMGSGFPQGSMGSGFPQGSAGSGFPQGSDGGQGLSRSERISAEVLKLGSPETRQLFVNYSKFIKSLMASIQGDLLVLKMLIMMSLFSADRSALVERGKVQAVQEHYATVLQHYASLRFTDDRTLFARLVMKLTDLRNINEVHSKMLTKMKVDDIEPLLLEIFDL
ncbi:thyroid hormone receptor alpha-like [Littorina saxatilis]|uniref:thyroid hormone receptor alpha-like n=1 Tax=Littorina saxatilis TaxID=31220 RepID=UPI0038B44E1A